MTNYRSDSKHQNNALATPRTQDMDGSLCFEIAWLVDGMEARGPTSMEPGLLLLLSINLRSDGISYKEAICIKILGPQKMFFLCSPQKCSSFEEHIKCFLIRKHKWIILLLFYRHLRFFLIWKRLNIAPKQSHSYFILS